MSYDCAKRSSHKNLFHAKKRLQTLLSMNVWLNSSLQWPSPTWEHCLVQGLRCFRSATSPSHESSWASKRIISKSQAFWEHQPLFVAVFLKFLGFLFDQTAAPCGWFQLPKKIGKKGQREFTHQIRDAPGTSQLNGAIHLFEVYPQVSTVSRCLQLLVTFFQQFSFASLVLVSLNH